MDQVKGEPDVAQDVVKADLDHPYVYGRADDIVNRWMMICALLIAFFLGVMSLEHYRVMVKADMLLSKTSENNAMLHEVMDYIRARLMEAGKNR